MLDEVIWKTLTGNPKTLQMTPPWVHPFFKMSFVEIQNLPQSFEPGDIEVIKKSLYYKPRLASGEITASYLDFLKREIRFRGSRSKRAAETYTGRHNALSDYEGKITCEMFITGWQEDHIRVCMLYFRPDDCDIIWVE